MHAPNAPGCLLNDPPHEHIEPKPKPKPKPAAAHPKIITADHLLAQQFPDIQWVVSGIIPEGATVLAGRPKMGKSWLALQLALTIAQGGTALGKIAVEPGDVLYLALEDGPRRLQKRLQKLLGVTGTSALIPASLHLATVWPRASEGGVEALIEWLDLHPDARLIVIDTLARIRDKRRGDVGVYEEDYEAIATFQQRSVAIKLVTHTRKPKNNGETDLLDEVQNSTGLTGAADAVLVLKRARYAREAKLFVTGRDVDEREIPLVWDPQQCSWSQGDEPDQDNPEAHLSAEQRKVRKLLKDAGIAMSTMEISARLKKEYDSTAKLAPPRAAPPRRRARVRLD